MSIISRDVELLGGLNPTVVTTMATPVMGVLVTPGEPAVGPPGHEPAASAAAWIEAFQKFLVEPAAAARGMHCYFAC